MLTKQTSYKSVPNNNANTLYYNEQKNNSYYTNLEEIFTKYATFADNSSLKYFHHLRADSVSYNNFLNDSQFKDFLYVQSAGYFITSYRYFCERKGLKSYLIIHTLEGSGNLSYLDNEYTLNAGDTILIDCMHYHKYFPNPDSDWNFLYLHFNGSLATTFYNESIKHNFKPFHINSDYNIEQNIRNIISSVSNNSSYKDLICFNTMNTMLTEIITKLYYDDTSCIPTYIDTVQKYLRCNFDKNVQLDELSKLINVSKYHLSREFKKYIGDTIQNHLINIRLAYAKNLLIHTNMSIDLISSQCGLKSCSHFIKTFKDRTNLTPLQYRKKWNSL